MTFLIVIGFIAVILFALAFLTKRRFGILGLSLMAGSYLATQWAPTLTPAVESTGITLIAPPLQTVVAVVLTLLPALLLFVSSPTYHGKTARLIGAIGFALFTIVLLINPLAEALVIDGPAVQVHAAIVDNYALLVTIGLVAAIIDLFLAKSHSFGKSRAGKH